MCGRFARTTPVEELARRFHFDAPELLIRPPAYNIAPTQDVLSVIHDGTMPRARYVRWGLIPSWAKDPRMGSRLINARSETVASKPSFRSALQRRRCLILADGFFEWQRQGRAKIPMYIRLRAQVPFAMAGLWDTWHDAEGNTLSTCTIVTTTANTLMQPIHERMPVIIAPEGEALWLDRQCSDPQQLLPLLVPYEATAMEAYPVSTLVNSPRHNSPECLKIVEAS